MNALQRALIEKLGHDHGFEHVLPNSTARVELASALHSARVQVSLDAAQGYLLTVQAAVPTLLPEMRRSFSGAQQTDGFAASTEAEVAALLRRAASLARALPNQAVQDFEAEAARRLAELPEGLGGTEVERLVRQRIGQQKFRGAMLDYWGGACAVTGVALPEVLRASHAKPWAECSSDAERLDVFNGFLLVANLDALFDAFLISFDDGGRLLASSRLADVERRSLGLVSGMGLRWLSGMHRSYLAWHRERLQR